MRLLVVCVVATSLMGCSFVVGLRHQGAPPPASCAGTDAAWLSDLAGAGLLIAAMGSVTSGPADADQPSIGTVEAIGVTALLLLSSGLGGMDAGVACHVEQRAREKRAREEAALEQRVATREQAWKLTEQAEGAARTGDCATVVRLGTEIAAIDSGVHDVVFERDRGVAACLQPTQVR